MLLLKMLIMQIFVAQQSVEHRELIPVVDMEMCHSDSSLK